MTSTCSHSAPDALCAASARRAKSAESRLGAIWQATPRSLEVGRAPARAADGVSREGHAAAEGSGLEQRESRYLDALGEQRPTSSLDRGVDEQSVLVDE